MNNLFVLSLMIFPSRFRNFARRGLLPFHPLYSLRLAKARRKISSMKFRDSVSLQHPLPVALEANPLLDRSHSAGNAYDRVPLWLAARVKIRGIHQRHEV